MQSNRKQIKQKNMAKVNFIYIGKSMEYLIPKSDFCALKLSNKDKKELYPSWDEETIKNTSVLCPCGLGDKEVFVYGLGWKKLGKKNWVNVPLFSGEIEDWDNYLKEYGKECLFYSLTGYSLKSNDCCANNMVEEFLSLLQCKGGIEQYQKYVENIEAIQEIQTEVFNEKLSYMTDYSRKKFINKNLIRPCYRVFLFISTPYLDTPTDDNKLECFYRTYRNHEIKTSHPDYARMVELRESVRKEAVENPYVSTEMYYEHKEELDAIRKRITDHILDVLAEETEEGEKNVFPICMADRMKFLFGEECHNLYKYILEHFED